MKPKNPFGKPKLKMVGELLCNTCQHREKCREYFKKDHLSIRVIENEKTGDCFGGYYCRNIPYNSIPFSYGTDWFWEYKYHNLVDSDEYQSKKLPNFPKVEENFILIDDNES